MAEPNAASTCLKLTQELRSTHSQKTTLNPLSKNHTQPTSKNHTQPTLKKPHSTHSQKTTLIPHSKNDSDQTYLQLSERLLDVKLSAP